MNSILVLVPFVFGISAVLLSLLLTTITRQDMLEASYAAIVTTVLSVATLTGISSLALLIIYLRPDVVG